MIIIIFFFNTSLVEKIDSVVFQFSGVEPEEHSLFFFFYLFSGVQLMSAACLVIWVTLNGV